MVPLVFFFFLMNIPPVHPWDTNQENYNGLFKGFFEENKTIFSLVRKSGKFKAQSSKFKIQSHAYRQAGT